MINLFKYRKLGIVTLITMIISFLLSIVTLWNYTLDSEAHHAGWIVFFFILLFGSGVFMFLIVYRMSDQEMLDGYVQSLLQDEKSLQDASAGEFQEEASAGADSLTEDQVDESVKQILSDLDVKSTKDFCDQLLRSLAKHLEFVQGILYIKEKKGRKFVPAGSFALNGKDPEPFENGDGIAGEATESKMILRINDIPEKYFEVSSGLGNARPKNLLFVPIVYRNQSIGLIEIGSFRKPEEITEKILHHVSEETGKILHNLISR